MPSLVSVAETAMANCANEAAEALSLFKSHCGGALPRRVPGMDTIIRLAIRIDCGSSIEEAAAKEYVYRWSLAIKAPDQCVGAMTRNPCVSVFGVPHTLGM